MTASDPETTGVLTPPPQAPSPSSSFSDNWQNRLLLPTLLAGLAGGGAGFLSRHRRVHGLPNMPATYATNFAIVAGCYCGMREFVRVTRKSEPDDLLNSAVAGFGTGAILGRLQGGRLGAYRYSILFTAAGTALDFGALKLRPMLGNFIESMRKKDGWLKLPEWSPIQILDDEALAAKQTREKKLYGEAVLGNLGKEES